jgi:hypothetical protein
MAHRLVRPLGSRHSCVVSARLAVSNRIDLINGTNCGRTTPRYWCPVSPINDVQRCGIISGMQTIYEAAGGNQGLSRLAAAWHERVLADEIVAHPFSHGVKPDHIERLAAYWAEALGGPAAYTERYGDETSVVRMHSCAEPHEGNGPAGDRLLRPGTR